MEQTSRSDPLVTRSVRAEKPAVKWNCDVGHGGGQFGANRRSGTRQHDQQGLPADRSEGEGIDGGS